MKKSFIFGITMVLTLLLVFAGCGQSTSSSDDDGDSGGSSGGQVSLQNDLAAIAAAFSDGRADEVTVTTPLYLYSGELVIPRGKTLRFDNVGIEGVTDNSKLIGAGTLIYPSGKTVDWRDKPGARLIVTEAFKNQYVGDSPDSGKPLVADENQIVYIKPFADFRAHAASPGSVPGFYSYYGILALESPGIITEADAKALGEHTKGLKVYIVGNVTSFSAKIDLTTTANANTVPVYTPAASASSGVLANYDNALDADGVTTLVVAGDVSNMNGKSVKADGFTVWGTLKGSADGFGKEVTEGKDTKLVAYTALLNGPIFEGPVQLAGPIVNEFGTAVTFSGDVTINGPSRFTEAKFDGNATFNGHVTFLKRVAGGVYFNGAIVEFTAGAEIGSELTFGDAPDGEDVTLKISGSAPVKFVGFDPSDTLFVKVSSAGGKAELSASPDKPLEFSSYEGNLIITGDAVVVGTASTEGETIDINGNVTFDGTVTFDAPIELSGTASLTVNGNATFNNGVNFGTISEEGGSHAAVYIKNPTFNGTEAVTGIADLKIGGSGPDNPGIIVNGYTDSNAGAGTASLKLSEESQLTTSGGKLKLLGAGSITGAVVTLNSGSGLELAKDAQLNFLIPGAEGGTPTVTFAGTGKNGGGFTVNSGELLLSNSLKGTTSSSGEAPKADVWVSNDLELTLEQGYLPIENAILNLNKGGAASKIIFATMSALRGGSQSALVLSSGGELITNKGKAAGGIIIGTQGASEGTVSLITGSTSTSGWGTLAGTNNPGDINGSISNVITKATLFTGGTEATVDNVTTYTVLLPGNLIEVFKAE
jgi:hypothetical protein